MTASGDARARRGAVRIAAVVGAAFAVLALLGVAASTPRFFNDELFYMEAGVSLGQGDGLAFRGEEWGYGPVYPALIAFLVRLTGDQETTYDLVKVLNALCFALAAVPVFVLARRLLPRRPALVVAVAAVALPSSMYVSVSMTESVAYLLAASAVTLTALVLERPTAVRQLATLAIIAAAVATRPQLVSLAAGYAVALVAGALTVSGLRDEVRSRPRRLWPTGLAAVAGLAVFIRAATGEEGFAGAFGSYGALAQGYDIGGIVWWSLRHLGALVLYSGFALAAAAPAAVVLLWSRGRNGPARAVAIAALAQTAAALGVVGAFASTDFGQGLLFDRYLFWLLPGWIAVVLAWALGGAPRSRRTAAAGVVCAIVPVAVLPFASLAEENWFRQFQAVGTELWGKVGSAAARLPGISALGVALACAVVIAALTLAGPRRLRIAAAGAVALTLAANLLLAWRSAFVDPDLYGLPPRGERSWVDDVLPTRARAVVLGVARPCDGERAGFAGIETEYFNRTVSDGGLLGGEAADAPDRLRVTADGTLERRSGAPFRAVYVVAPPGVELVGAVLAQSQGAGLVLWRTDGRVRAASARNDADLLASPCP